MYSSHDLDNLAEPMTAAASAVDLASPLAETPATLVAQATETVVQAPVAAVAAPLVAVAAPIARTVQAPAAPLGTLAPSTAATLPMLGALLLVVGLILLLGKVVKRVQKVRAGDGPTLSIKGGVQIGSKERVVWMQAGDTHLLLGVSPGRVQTLHVFDVPPDFQTQGSSDAATATASDANTPATKDFSERLKTLLAHARARGLETDVVVPAAAAAAAPGAAAPAAGATAATSKPTFSFRA